MGANRSICAFGTKIRVETRFGKMEQIKNTNHTLDLYKSHLHKFL
jgi:hypothetical protein